MQRNSTQALHLLKAIMPVQLPLAPAGVNLPAQPQNPPTLADIASAIDYYRNIETGYSMFFFSIYLNLKFPVTGQFIYTRDDMARAAVYQAAVIEENAGAGGGV